MQIDLRSNFARRILAALEWAAFLSLSAWVAKTYVAGRLGQTGTLQKLQVAAKLDRGNAEHHLQLGRLYQYGMQDIDPEKAVEEFKRATELSPHDAQPWLDLAAALEFQGKVSEAEACLHRASSLAPNLPFFQWSIGNSFLLHGNVDEAFRHFKVVLGRTSRYNQLLFSRAWKSAGDGDKILHLLIPDNVSARFSYLNYLAASQRYPEAQNVWKRIARSTETFAPQEAASYIDQLIRTRRPREAYQVWIDLRNKGLIQSTYQEKNGNLVVNGDFEEAPLNMGFDWRIAGVEGVYAGLDESEYHSGGHALLIQFPGDQNLDYHQTYQYVRVVPARSYRLSGFMKTEGITTDSGPRFEVRDAYDLSELVKLSEPVPETTGSWAELTLDFTTGPKTELVAVGVSRLRSHKFDNKIAGRVWVDDLSLTRLEERAGSGRKLSQGRAP